MFIDDRKALILAILRQREPRQELPVHREIRHKTSKQKAKAEEEAAQEAWDTVKAAWIEAHGSDRLKKAHATGYPHNRAYTQERATVELGGGWTVDTKNAYEWDRKACPSGKALDLEKMLKDRGFKAQTVWVKSDGAERDDDDAFEPFETVVVREFLGRYDVIHKM
ncbi:MAG: hypothetical protein ABSH25_22130 [Syntrophorhabdales bacterium]|jgi:Fe-S cluster assembly scaffold protein SufB